MMKKRFLISIFTILVAVSFIVGLAACGGSETLDVKEAGPSDGLNFYEYEDHCVVTGIGTCTDEDIVIPSEHDGLSVTAIDDGAFYYSKTVTSITIPDSVTSIGDDAFYYCTYLKDVEMGEGIEYIGHRAFYFCKALENITLPDSVTTVGNSAFESCTSLKSVNIPENVTTMGEKAFVDCTAMDSLYFNSAKLTNDTLSDLFEGAGENGITLTIGPVITEIPKNLFSSFSSLEEVRFEDETTCESFGEYSFAYCYSLKTATLPESLTELGDYSFYDCTAMENLYVNAVELYPLWSMNYVFYHLGQSSGVTVTIGKNVTRIPQYMFCPYNYGNSTYTPTFEAVIFEEDSKCSSIDDYAFFMCRYLTSIEIPGSVISIGAYAFYDCNTLTTVTINNGLTSIGASAFEICSRLKTVNIPDSVTSIGIYAFYMCGALENVTIGTGLTTIGTYAFYSCSKLTVLYYFGSPSDWEEISIGTYNYPLTVATICCYSETEPDYDDGYSYWHYVDDEIVVWIKED